MQVRIAVWAALLLVYYFSNRPPLIFACWACLVALILIRPVDGVWLASAVLPFYFQHKVVAFGDALQFSAAPAVVVSLCMAPALLMDLHHTRRRSDRWDWLAVSWLMIAILSAAHVWYWPAYWTGLLELVVCPLILFWSVRAFVSTRAECCTRWLSSRLGGVAFAAIGLYGWIQGNGVDVDSVRRLTGTFYSPNHAALYLERVTFILIALAVALHGKRRIAAVVASGFVATALFLTASRGALFLALPAGMMIIALYAFRSQNRTQGRVRSRLVWIGGSVAVTVAIALLVTSGQRLTNLNSIVERLELWRQSLQLARDYWLTGVGQNGFFWRFPAYISVKSSLDPNLLHPHNIWFEYTTIGGVWALMWLLAALALVALAVIRQYRRHPKRVDWLPVGLIAALVAGLAHAQVDAFGALPDLAMFNWLLLGLLIVQTDLTVPTEPAS